MPAVPIGPLELVIILFIVLLFFGAKRLPETGRSLGRSMREFKEEITSGSSGDQAPEPVALEDAQRPAGARQATSSDVSSTT